MKTKLLIVMLCYGITTHCSETVTNSPNAKQYYTSNSPYITQGYLGYRRQLNPTNGPSPYWFSRKAYPVSLSSRRKYV